MLKNTQQHPHLKPTQTTHLTDIQVANPWFRLIAILYDGMLILALLFLVSTVLIVLGTPVVGTTAQEAQQLPAWYRHLVMFPAMLVTLIGFYGVFWRRAGQTLGMQTWRLKTINKWGYLLSWRQVLVRMLAACVLPAFCAVLAYLIYQTRLITSISAFLGVLGNYLFALLHRQGLAVHDILSDTVTVRIPKTAHNSIFTGFGKKKQK